VDGSIVGGRDPDIEIKPFLQRIATTVEGPFWTGYVANFIRVIYAKTTNYDIQDLDYRNAFNLVETPVTSQAFLDAQTDVQNGNLYYYHARYPYISQDLSGSIDIGNTPHVVVDSGSIGVSNFPTSFGVNNFPTGFNVNNFPTFFSVDNFPTNQQVTVTGQAHVIVDAQPPITFPSAMNVNVIGQPVHVSVDNFPSTSGTVDARLMARDKSGVFQYVTGISTTGPDSEGSVALQSASYAYSGVYWYPTPMTAAPNGVRALSALIHARDPNLNTNAITSELGPNSHIGIPVVMGGFPNGQTASGWVPLGAQQEGTLALQTSPNVWVLPTTPYMRHSAPDGIDTSDAQYSVLYPVGGHAKRRVPTAKQFVMHSSMNYYWNNTNGTTAAGERWNRIALPAYSLNTPMPVNDGLLLRDRAITGDSMEIVEKEEESAQQT
jgi:hypothetical protein